MIVRSSRVIVAEDERPASIHIDAGRIVRIDDERAVSIDFGDHVISAGLVDTHVHVNEPGRTDWEGFDTATRAAAAGGITTIVDMPLNSVPATTTVAALEKKRDAARAAIHVDVGFWGGVVPGNAAELDALVDAGVRGFKCFLAPSGVDEFEHVGERDLREAMPILTRRGVALLVHAEDPRHLCPPAEAVSPTYRTYLATRPPAAEVSAIDLMVRLSKELGTRIHIVHVASAEAADAVARAKADGVAITAETCPHYLSFAADHVPDGATEFKCAPPIREARHRDALWTALEHGTLDLIASDHSPAPPSMKPRGDFLRAWGGIASLELSLAVCATAAERGSVSSQRRVALQRWLSTSPAQLARLNRKGRIAVGCDADLVVWDPDAETTVDPTRLQQRHKLTPYVGRRLRGVVKATFLRGEPIWMDGALVGAARGQLL